MNQGTVIADGEKVCEWRLSFNFRSLKYGSLQTRDTVKEGFIDTFFLYT